MDNQGVKVISAVVNPVPINTGTDNSKAGFQQKVEEASNVMQDVLDGLSDEIPEEDEEVNEQYEEATGFLNKFINYIQSKSFTDSVNSAAKKYNVPPKKVAEGFFGKILGTIGDVAGIAISTAGNGLHTVIDVLATIAHGAVDVVISVASAIASIFTCNKTCMA